MEKTKPNNAKSLRWLPLRCKTKCQGRGTNYSNLQSVIHLPLPQLLSSTAKLLLPKGSLSTSAGPLVLLRFQLRDSVCLGLSLLSMYDFSSFVTSYLTPLSLHVLLCSNCPGQRFSGTILCIDFLMLASPAARNSRCFWVLILINE